MDFVNGNRSICCLPVPSPLHPFCVAPAIMIWLGDNRSCLRRRFGLARHGVRFPRQDRAIGTDDIVFVARAWRDPWDEEFPNSRPMAYAHRMPPAIPGIEITDNCDPLGIGRPN